MRFTKWLLLALLALGPAQAQQSVFVPATTSSVAIVGTASGTSALLVTGATGQRIYVTAVDLVPVATAVVTFTQGTGATCGTGSANLTGALTFAAGQTYSKGTGNGAVWVLTAGNSLCVTIATAAAPGSIAVSQF